MMSIYRFSPIEDKERLFEAVEYVSEQALKLSKKMTGNVYPISYLTIFAHYQDEYDSLVGILPSLGKVTDANNGLKVELAEPLSGVTQLRIRKPDPYRMQVGCTDIDVGKYDDFKSTYFNESKNLRLIERAGYEMIEFFDPDFDVFVYVVSN